MPIFYLVQLENDIVLQKSGAIEADEAPEVVPPYTDAWTDAQWQAYLNSQNPPAPTLADYMATNPAKPYADFRAAVLAICLEMGNGNEAAGFDAATAEEKEFFALNLIGTKLQRAAVLSDENKQVLEWQLSKGVIR